MDNYINHSRILLLALSLSIIFGCTVKPEEFYNAIENEDVKNVRRLLEKQPGLANSGSVLWTPLHAAVETGNIEICKVLISYGADVNEKYDGVKDGVILGDFFSGSPLHLAAEEGKKDICELLIHSGANVNAIDYYRETPLIKAARNGHLGICRLLFANGAKINIERSHNPLYAAAYEGHLEVCELLISKGAKTDIFIEAAMGRIKGVKQKLDEQPDLINSRRHGRNLLHWAVSSGQTDVCRLLILRGADIKNDGLNEPLLHLAASKGHGEVCDILVENGTDVNINYLGETPLHKAAFYGHKEVCELLIENGADVNSGINENDFTPLHMAAAAGHKDICEFLLSKGADINAITIGCNETTTLPEWAVANGHKEIADLLRKHGAVE
jgi:ankyrin repeat protein